jgi:hypothetical protein
VSEDSISPLNGGGHDTNTKGGINQDQNVLHGDLEDNLVPAIPPSSPDSDIPALSGRDLLAAIHHAETGAGFEEDGGEEHNDPIPLAPKYLSADEISALMRTDAYRTWHHPNSDRVRETVSRWFELTYPGPLNVDASGRTIRTEDRYRPASAPYALTELGPLSLQRARRFTPQAASPALSARRQRFLDGIRRSRDNF